VRDTAVGVLVERTATLPAVPSSVGVARGLLRAALMQAGRSRWADDGELALSEVVTNAVLHAHTEITLIVRVHPEAVDVEVWDLNRAPPLARHYEREATTGRGMALVAAVTSECGVRRLPDVGKVVWFRLGDPAPAQDGSVEDLLAAWDVTGDWDLSNPREPETRQVLLCGMPPALWLAAAARRRASGMTSAMTDRSRTGH
jgi:anti-sigma regulatory factor (Ser/Thr protein kinase)